MEKVWTIYILECADGTLYTGITDCLVRRLRAHSEGRGAKYTRGRGPLTLRYVETVPDKSTALKREYALKRLRRPEKLALISENAGKIKSLLAIAGQMPYTKDKQCGPCPHGEE